MIDLTSFRVRFPEFKTTPDATVIVVLNQAAARIDASVYGDLTDEAHGYLAAHILAVSPFGKDSRLQSDKADSVYGKQLRSLISLVGAGWGVL